MMAGLGLGLNGSQRYTEIKGTTFRLAMLVLGFALVSAMGIDPEHYVITRCWNNIPTHLWSFPAAEPDDLRNKLGKGEDLRGKLHSSQPCR